MDAPPRIVVHISREYGNLLAEGGVKDFTRGICAASARTRLDTYLFLPFPYDETGLAGLRESGKPLRLHVPLDRGVGDRTREETVIRTFEDPGIVGLTLYLVQSARFTCFRDQDPSIPRDSVYTYSRRAAMALGRPDLVGKRYVDSLEMNALLVKSALLALVQLELEPDLIHAHDAQLGFLPLVAQYSSEGLPNAAGRIPAVVTFHSLMDYYRGESAYDESIPAILGVPSRILERTLHRGAFEPVLIAGLFGAALNTVSENCATRPPALGFRLEVAVARAPAVRLWNPHRRDHERDRPARVRPHRPDAHGDPVGLRPARR